MCDRYGGCLWWTMTGAWWASSRAETSSRRRSRPAARQRPPSSRIEFLAAVPALQQAGRLTKHGVPYGRPASAALHPVLRPFKRHARGLLLRKLLLQLAVGWIMLSVVDHSAQLFSRTHFHLYSM